MSEREASTFGMVVSGDHGSAGKTTYAIGLSRCLSERGHVVQTFKKGPDFIDPMWLGRASGRPSANLDFLMMGEEGIRARFEAARRGSGVVVIEGNKGLFDGVDLEGTNSTSALARLLGLPVVLVVDCTRTTRGIAPLLLGYSAFEKDLRIAGVVLNNVSGSRHEGKLRAAVERYTDLAVLGAVPRLDALSIRERHLGLTPDVETTTAETVIAACARAVSEGTDLDRLLDASARLGRASSPRAAPPSGARGSRVTIAVARDAAFSFYYPEALEALREAGAELEFFSPLDGRLPACDGVYLGGGFPELYAERLSANRAMLDALGAHAIEGVVYAECGGLMLLAASLSTSQGTCPMAGVLPLDAVMADRPQGRGYMRLSVIGGNHLWELPSGGGLWAHEFHHSRVVLSQPSAATFAYRVERGAGMTSGLDGILQGGVLASYAHLHPAAAPWWAGAFVGAIRRTQVGAAPARLAV